ncbi:hypothetical protein V2J09_022638 [Rumex salicifolius]
MRMQIELYRWPSVAWPSHLSATLPCASFDACPFLSLFFLPLFSSIGNGGLVRLLTSSSAPSLEPDPDEEEWRFQRFRPPDKSVGRLRQIWKSGLNLGKNIALTGILVSAAPLALPPLVVLSAFGVAFSIPSGFYIASYAATDKIMTALLTIPKQPQKPLPIQHEDVRSDEQERAYEVEEDGYEEDYDLEEEDKELEDDTRTAFKVQFDLDEEENSQFVGEVSNQLEIEEDHFKDLEDVITDKFEQDGYEEDVGEYTGKDQPIPCLASEIVKGLGEVEVEIPSMKEGSGEILEIGVEVGGVSVEIIGENDIAVEQVEVVNVFGPQVSMEDSRSMVKFGDVDLEELEKDTTGRTESISDTMDHEISLEIEEASLGIATEMKVDIIGPREHPSELEREMIGMIESNRDEGVSETIYHEHSMEKEEHIPNTISSEILRGIKEAEEEMSSVEDPNEDGVLENDVEAVVISAEVGGENDINVEQVDVFAPRVSIEDSSTKVKFGDVDPEELERETTGIIESIRDEGISEIKNPKPSLEKEEPVPNIPKAYGEVEEEIPLVEEAETIGMIELAKGEDGSEATSHEVLMETGEADPSTTSELLKGVGEAEENVPFFHKSPKETESPFIPDESNLDIKGILESQEVHREPGEVGIADNLELLMAPSKKQTAEVIAVLQEEHSVIASTSQKDAVRATKLVVHFSKSGDSTSISSARGETLILKAGIPQGMNSTDEVQDTYVRDATSKPIEGLNNEVSIWKQINALRTIVGYEAPPHASCVEELKALYMFTGVEPPALFSECVDVYDKLLFLMTVVGVKEIDEMGTSLLVVECDASRVVTDLNADTSPVKAWHGYLKRWANGLENVGQTNC